MDVYPHYRGVAAFVADIPYTSGRLEPVAAEASLERIRVLGLGDAERAHLWLFDGEAAWIGKGLEGVEPAEVTGLVLTVGDLADRTYRVAWWDTREGTVFREDEAATPR